MLSAGADTARGPGVALLCESFDKKLYKNFWPSTNRLHIWKDD
jgi:hypothetical protein